VTLCDHNYVCFGYGFLNEYSRRFSTALQRSIWDHSPYFDPPLPVILLFCLSSCRLSVAEHSSCHRQDPECTAWWCRFSIVHRPTHPGINGKLFCSSDPSVVRTLVDLATVLITKTIHTEKSLTSWMIDAILVFNPPFMAFLLLRAIKMLLFTVTHWVSFPRTTRCYNLPSLVHCFILNSKLSLSENLLLHLFQHSLFLSVGLISWLYTFSKFLCSSVFMFSFLSSWILVTCGVSAVAYCRPALWSTVWRTLIV